MKFRSTALLLLMIAFLQSCTKDPLVKNSFVTICNSSNNSFNRNIIELSDKSIIVCGLGKDENGFHSIEINKLDKNGQELIHKSWHNVIYDPWRAVSSNDGGFIVAGYDSTGTWPQLLRLAKFSGDGELTDTASIPLSQSSLIYKMCDMIQMHNGNIAIAETVEGIGGPSNYFNTVALIEVDDHLNILLNKKFNNLIYYVLGSTTLRLAEAQSGNIYFTYCTDSSNTGTNHLSIIKIRKGSFQPVSFIKYEGDTLRNPEGITIDKNENVSVATCKNLNRWLQPNFSSNYGNFLFGEWLTYGPTVSVLTSDSFCQHIAWNNYSGFQQNAIITNMITTSDGGYLMVGTSNQRDNLDLYSANEILLIKTDANHKQQWMKQINTQSSAWGTDVKQSSDGGFIISAFTQLPNQKFQTLVIKTDANGNY